MEQLLLLPSEIARLVLGYLEEEHCSETCKSFLETSAHLKECHSSLVSGRKFYTQVMGSTLKEILDEYFCIRTLVQDHFDKACMNDCEHNVGLSRLSKTSSLLEKLKLLLNAQTAGQTMLLSITVPPSSSSIHSKGKSKTNASKNRDKSQPNLSNNFEKNIHISDANVNFTEATSLDSLPGHSGSNRTFKRKSSTPISKNASALNENLPDFDYNELLTQALLENHELHEKIAENINKVIGSSENDENKSKENIKNNKEPTPIEIEPHVAIDNAIKTIVEQTENEPEFEKIVTELIGKVSEETSDSDALCSSWSISSTPQRSRSLPRDQFITRRRLSCYTKSLPDIFHNSKRKDIALKMRLKKSKQKQSEINVEQNDAKCLPKSSIDDQNAEAIQSIIDTMNKSKTEETNVHTELTSEPEKNIVIKTPPDLTSLIQNSHKDIFPIETTVNSDIVNNHVHKSVINNDLVLFDGSLDKYLQISNPVPPMSSVQTTQATTTQTTVFPSNLLMQQPSGLLLQPPPGFIITTQPTTSYIMNQDLQQKPAFHSDLNQHLFFIQNSPIGLVTSVQSQMQSRSVITKINEQDIMQMPTVIVRDDTKTSKSIQNKNIQPKNRTIRRIQPVPVNSTTKNSTSNAFVQADKEPITLYSTNDVVDSVMVDCNINRLDLSGGLEEKKQEVNKKETCQISDIHVNIQLKNTDSCITEASSAELKNIGPEKEPTTPIVKQNDKTGVRMTMSTPRSGRSHVRALDFSTPSKNVSSRKSFTSPKSAGIHNTPRTIERRKTGLFKTSVRSSLFKSPKNTNNIPIATRSPRPKLIGEWDQVQGVGLIFNASETNKVELNEIQEEHKRKRSLSESDATSENLSPVQNTQVAEKTIKDEIKTNKVVKTWDSDLRALLCNEQKNSTSPSRKKKTKRKAVAANKPESKKKSEKIQPPSKLQETNNGVAHPTKRITRSSTTSQKNLKQPETVNTKKNKKNTNKPQLKNKRSSSIVSNDIDKKNDAAVKKDSTIDSAKNSNQIEEVEEDIIINRNAPSKYKRKCNSANLIVIDTKPVITIEKFTNDCNQVLIEDKEPKSKSEDIKKSEHQITPDMIKIHTAFPISASCNLFPMLETPCKDVFNDIPITPRFMNNLSTEDTPITKLLKEQTNILTESIVPTPIFPITPNLAITPKLPNVESPGYSSRPTDYSTCSSYYLPSDNDQNVALEQILISECAKQEEKEQILSKQLDCTSSNKKAEYLLHEISLPEHDICRELDKSKYPDSCRTDLLENTTETDVQIVETDLKKETINIKNSSSGNNNDCNIIEYKVLNTSDLQEKMDNSTSSCSSCDSSSSSSSSDSSNTAEKTVIQRKSSPSINSTSPRYQLRNRIQPAKEKKLNFIGILSPKETPAEMKPDGNINVDIKTDTLPSTSVTNKISVETFTDVKLYNELEEKRKRVITKIKDNTEEFLCKKPSIKIKFSKKQVMKRERKVPIRNIRTKPTVKRTKKVLKEMKSEEMKVSASCISPQSDMIQSEHKKYKQFNSKPIDNKTVIEENKFPSLTNIPNDNDQQKFINTEQPNQIKHTSSNIDNKNPLNIDLRENIQESDSESTIALVTHLKERGILLMPNKKNKNRKSQSSSDLKSKENEKHTIQENVIEVKQKEDLNEHKNELEKKPEKNNDSKASLISVQLLKDDEKIDPSYFKPLVNIDNSDQKVDKKTEEKVDIPNDSFTCDDTFEEIYTKFNDDLNKLQKPLQLTSNSDLSKYSLEYVIEGSNGDEIHTLQISSFINLWESLPIENSKTSKTSNIHKKAENNSTTTESDVKLKKPNHKKRSTPRKKKLTPLEKLYAEISDNTNDSSLSQFDTNVDKYKLHSNETTKNESDLHFKFSSKENDSDRDLHKMNTLKLNLAGTSGNLSEIVSDIKKDVDNDSELEEGEWAPSPEDDELMTYVTVVSSKEKDVPENKPVNRDHAILPKKRKIPETSPTLLNKCDKKSKGSNPQELLQKLDLDSFLSKVHGPNG